MTSIWTVAELGSPGCATTRLLMRCCFGFSTLFRSLLAAAAVGSVTFAAETKGAENEVGVDVAEAKAVRTPAAEAHWANSPPRVVDDAAMSNFGLRTKAALTGAKVGIAELLAAREMSAHARKGEAGSSGSPQSGNDMSVLIPASSKLREVGGDAGSSLFLGSGH